MNVISFENVLKSINTIFLGETGKGLALGLGPGFRLGLGFALNHPPATVHLRLTPYVGPDILLVQTSRSVSK